MSKYLAKSGLHHVTDVMDYEPDADMVFNYLMVSALAEATDLIEKKGIKPSGKDLQDLARKVCALHKLTLYEKG